MKLSEIPIPFVVVALVAGLVILLYWQTIQIRQRRYLDALILLFAALPILHKLSNLLDIFVYQNPSRLGGGYIQKFYISFLPLLIILFNMTINSDLKSVDLPFNKRFNKYFRFFIVTVAVSLMINHTMRTAILFFWMIGVQFYILYIIVMNVVKTVADLKKLIVGLFAFFVVNVGSRVLLDGQPFVPILTGEYFRVGANSMGPAVSYALYIVVLTTLFISIFKFTVGHMTAIALLFVELLNTFTRGGLFVLIFLVGLIFFNEKLRSKAFRIVLLLIGALILVYPLIEQVFLARSTIDSLTSESSLMVRVDLVFSLISGYSLSLFGNGVGNPTYLFFYRIPLPIHNAFLEILDQVGIIAFIAFITMIGHSFISLIKMRYINSDIMHFRPYFIIAQIQWFVYANTTATSILYYYPYEAMMFFWIIIFSPFLLSKINETIPHA